MTKKKVCPEIRQITNQIYRAFKQGDWEFLEQLMNYAYNRQDIRTTKQAFRALMRLNGFPKHTTFDVANEMFIDHVNGPHPSSISFKMRRDIECSG